MKIDPKSKILFLLSSVTVSIVVFLLTYGCIVQDRSIPTQPIKISQTPVTQTLSRSLVESPSVSPEPFPTNKLFTSQTPTIESLISITETITPTNIPTLTADEVKSLIFSLLRDNGDCQFPCLWGLIPGVTSDQALQNFMKRFGEISTPELELFHSNYTDMGGITLTSKTNDISTQVGLNYYENQQIIEQLFMFLFAMRDDVEVFGDPEFVQLIQTYLLPNLLSTYGHPTQVLVAAWPEDSSVKATWRPFSIVLNFPEYGAVAEYIMPVEPVGDSFRGCPGKVAYVHLWLRSPIPKTPLAEIVSKDAGLGINAKNTDYFRLLEDAAGMTVDDFYKIFKNPKNTACLETPKNLWPLN
jgi:hypothetical protein